jgi:hypothetical protein
MSKTKKLNRYEFTKEDSIKGGNKIAGKSRPGRRVQLTEDDWLSHMLHLASMKFKIAENVRGCKVCKWYNSFSGNNPVKIQVLRQMSNQRSKQNAKRNLQT